MKNRGSFCWFSGILAGIVALSTGIGSARAATIAVTTTTDELDDPGPGDGCSLREAIQSVNGAADYGGCAHSGDPYGTSDTIDIPAATYTIAILGPPDELFNASGSFDILDSVTLVGAGAPSTIIDGALLDRVFFINGPFAVSFSGVTITNGMSGGGSGIYNSGGTLTVRNSTISNNTASGAGCAGGIANGVDYPITIINSTISGNSAGYCGGGILAWGSLTVTNSTLSDNSAGSYGGGIFRGASGSGTVTVTNATISGNSAPNGGGIYSENQIGLSNSIVANQTSGADCSGSVTSDGYNLESATTCGFAGTGDLQNTDPLLGVLASNGGPTQTMELSVGSPAIDAGSCVQTHDQRGAPRPQGSECDIGAYEWAPLFLFADGFETGGLTGWSSAVP